MIAWTFLLLLGATARERDAATSTRYLDLASVRDVVDTQGLVGWQACLDEGAGLPVEGLALRLRIGGDGGLRAVEAPPGASACFLEATRGLRFREHDEDDVFVRFIVTATAGRVVAPVTVTIEKRDLQPLFLHVPPDLDAAERQALLEALGLARPAEP